MARHSKFCSSIYHLPGDQILADRGFTLEDDFAIESGSEFFYAFFVQDDDNPRRIN